MSETIGINATNTDRIDVGTCDLCGQEMGRAWLNGEVVDVWHPAATSTRACPPEPEGHPPSPEWDAFYATYRHDLGMGHGRPGFDHFQLPADHGDGSGAGGREGGEGA